MPRKTPPRDFPPERRAGARVPELRQKMGIGQREFAARLTEAGPPCSQPRMSHVERGHYLLEKEEVALIAKLLGVRASVLLDGTDDAEAIKIRKHRDDETRKVEALQAKRDELEAQLAEVDRAISYHVSVVRLYESKINSLYHGGSADGL